MNKLVLLLLIFAINSQAEDLNIIDLYLDKELGISNGWAGESFTLRSSDKKDYFVCHTVFGSGVPVVSEKLYPVQVISKRQIRFKIMRKKLLVLF